MTCSSQEADASSCTPRFYQGKVKSFTKICSLAYFLLLEFLSAVCHLQVENGIWWCSWQLLRVKVWKGLVVFFWAEQKQIRFRNRLDHTPCEWKFQQYWVEYHVVWSCSACCKQFLWNTNSFIIFAAMFDASTQHRWRSLWHSFLRCSAFKARWISQASAFGFWGHILRVTSQSQERFKQVESKSAKLQ